MDLILRTNQEERYGREWVERGPGPHQPYVRDVMETAAVKRHDADARRRIAYLAFQYLLQLELCLVAAAVTNRMYYDHPADGDVLQRLLQRIP